MRTLATLFVVTASLLFSAFSTEMVAQDRKTELGEKQRLVLKKMKDLETTISKVAEELAARGDNERAERLKATLVKAKENLIAVRMMKVVEMLNNSQWDDASKELGVISDRIDELIRMLLKDNREKMTKKEELDALEQWKKEIQNLLKEQKVHTNTTKKYTNKDETLKDSGSENC